MGGQVGDSGTLTGKDGETIEIFDTKRENNVAVHLANSIPSNPAQIFTARINEKNRARSAANHSATHPHTHEAPARGARDTCGSRKVHTYRPTPLRFDFSHFQKVSSEEIRKVEHIVNERIRRPFLLRNTATCR